MSLEILKLNKQIETAMVDAGYTKAKEIQIKTLSRIIGGQDIIATGPEGCGKTTAYILGVLMRLKYAQEEPPRALILVPDKESVITLLEKFELLGKNTGIKTIGLFPGPAIQGQKDALVDYYDVVIGTPDRVQTIYLRSGLNLNKLKMFVLDDADEIILKGLQAPVLQIAESIPKCQHLIITEVNHSKLERLTDKFLNYPVLVEVSELNSVEADTIEHSIYEVPNYKTKLNLLLMMMREREIFTKVLIYVTSMVTAENLYKALNKRFDREVGILNVFGEQNTFGSMEEFILNDQIRLLLVLNDNKNRESITDIPFILHFDVPEDKEIYIDRIILRKEDQNNQAITFVSDLEKGQIKKIEQMLGKVLPLVGLPEDLIIEGDRKNKVSQEEVIKQKTDDQVAHEKAFQEKKESNAKDYNYKYKDRLKMFGKKNRKNKRGL